jgi:hypothetical protein
MRRMAVLAVLAVFCSKSSAIAIAFSAEILSRRRFGERKNSEGDRCSLAVLRCFYCQKQEWQTWPRELQGVV